jgi:hypothetical protein
VRDNKIKQLEELRPSLVVPVHRTPEISTRSLRPSADKNFKNPQVFADKNV